MSIREAVAALEAGELSPSQQGHYQDCLDKGCSPVMALLLASRLPPGLKGTDQAFCEGARHRMNNMDPKNLEAIQEHAHAAGINTQGKFYCGSLGTYDDPMAWVATAEDVLTVAKIKDLEMEGVVHHKARRQPGDHQIAPPLLADHIVQERLEAFSPDTGGSGGPSDHTHLIQNRRKLAEEVVARHGRQA